MYQARTISDLNYRAARPNLNGSLGTKLGVYPQDTIVTVLEVKDDWAAIFRDSRLVYVSHNFLQKISEPTPVVTDLPDSVKIQVSDVRNKMSAVSQDLELLYYMLFHLEEFIDEIEVPTSPSFDRRVPDKNGWGWLLPVFSNFLWSDEDRHTDRGAEIAWDVAQALGANVYSPVDGKVIHTYRSKDDNGTGSPGQYGTFCIIETTAPTGIVYRHLLAHLNRTRLYVDIGDEVTTNTLLSHITLEGLTSDTHTHHSIRLQDNTKVRNDEFWNINDMFNCPLCRVSDYIQ